MVMVAQQILVLLVQVRALVEQQKACHSFGKLFNGVMVAQMILVLEPWLNIYFTVIIYLHYHFDRRDSFIYILPI